jgi:hypothetical protein
VPSRLVVVAAGWELAAVCLVGMDRVGGSSRDKDQARQDCQMVRAG